MERTHGPRRSFFAAAQPPPAQFLIALMVQAEKVGVEMPASLESCKEYAGDLIEELKKVKLLTQVRLSLHVTACPCLTRVVDRLR